VGLSLRRLTACQRNAFHRRGDIFRFVAQVPKIAAAPGSRRPRESRVHSESQTRRALATRETIERPLRAPARRGEGEGRGALWRLLRIRRRRASGPAASPLLRRKIRPDAMYFRARYFPAHFLERRASPPRDMRKRIFNRESTGGTYTCRVGPFSTPPPDAETGCVSARPSAGGWWSPRDTRRSLCVLSAVACVETRDGSPPSASPRPVWGELNFPNFDRASSTARCNLYRPRSAPLPPPPPPSRSPHVHTPLPRGGVAAPLVPHGNISAGRARRFRGVECIYRTRRDGERRTCGEVVREVTMLPPPPPRPPLLSACNSSLLLS